jgi:hypothetical protein
MLGIFLSRCSLELFPCMMGSLLVVGVNQIQVWNLANLGMRV